MLKYQDINPAATMVEVSNLISPELLGKIEVEAIVSNSSNHAFKLTYSPTRRLQYCFILDTIKQKKNVRCLG
jgi:hypothetical protein